MQPDYENGCCSNRSTVPVRLHRLFKRRAPKLGTGAHEAVQQPTIDALLPIWRNTRLTLACCANWAAPRISPILAGPRDRFTNKLSRPATQLICCAVDTSNTEPRCEILASSLAQRKSSNVPDKTSRPRHPWQYFKRSRFMLPAASMKLSLHCSKWLPRVLSHQTLNGISHPSAATLPAFGPSRPPRSQLSSTTHVSGTGHGPIHPPIRPARSRVAREPSARRNERESTKRANSPTSCHGGTFIGTKV